MRNRCRSLTAAASRLRSTLCRVGLLLVPALLITGCAEDMTLCAMPGSEACADRLEQAMNDTGVSAVSVAIVANHRLVGQWAHGRSGRNDARQVTPSTPFQAGDITRTFTALGVLAYLQRQDISLDTAVATSLPVDLVPTSDRFGPGEISLRHLLSGTAGLTPTRYPGFPFGEPVPGTLDLLRGTGFARNPALQRAHAPGESCIPGAAGYELLGYWLREQTATNLPIWQNRYVFAPLNVAARYRLLGLPPPALGHTALGQTLDSGYMRQAARASSGLWATPSDIAGLVMELLAAERGQGRVLYDRSLALAMLSPGDCSRGFGVNVQRIGNRTLWSMDGLAPGYRSRFVADPANGSAVVVMANGDGALPLVEALVDAIRREYSW